MNVDRTPLSRYCLVKWMEGIRSGKEDVVPGESVQLQPQLGTKDCRVVAWRRDRSATKYLAARLVFHHDDFLTVSGLRSRSRETDINKAIDKIKRQHREASLQSDAMAAENSDGYRRRIGSSKTTQPTASGHSEGESVDERPRYFVVQFKKSKYYVCVPTSWLRPVAGNLKVNAEALVPWHKRWHWVGQFIACVERGKPPVCKTVCSVKCVFATDSYKVGLQWTDMMNDYYRIISANKKVIEDEAGTVPRSRSPLSSCPRPAKIPRTTDKQLSSTAPPPPHSSSSILQDHETEKIIEEYKRIPDSTLASGSKKASQLLIASQTAVKSHSILQSRSQLSQPSIPAQGSYKIHSAPARVKFDLKSFSSTSTTNSPSIPTATATTTSPSTPTQNPDPTSTLATSSPLLPSTSATATITSTQNPDPTTTSATSRPSLPSTPTQVTPTPVQSSNVASSTSIPPPPTTITSLSANTSVPPEETTKQSSNVNPTSAVNPNLSEAVKITKKEIQSEYMNVISRIAEVNVELERKCKETVMNIQSSSIKFHEVMKPYYDYCVKTGAQKTN